MKASLKTLRICSKGHRYYKSSDCPMCSICEKEYTPSAQFLITLSGPARRALENHGINTPAKLSKFSESEILQFHGMGPGSIPKLKAALKEKGLSFRKNK